MTHTHTEGQGQRSLGAEVKRCCLVVLVELWLLSMLSWWPLSQRHFSRHFVALLSTSSIQGGPTNGRFLRV